MSTEEKRADPTAAELMEQVAAGSMEQILPQNLTDILMNVRPEDLIEADSDTEVVKGPAQPSVSWIHAPAQMELLATADRRLTRMAEMAGISVKRVEKVRARVIGSAKLLVIQPAQQENMTAFPVNRYANQSSAWINLIDLLSKAHLTVQTGHKERYEVNYLPQGSPLFPGLFIDLSDPKERKQESRQESKQESNK